MVLFTLAQSSTQESCYEQDFWGKLQMPYHVWAQNDNIVSRIYIIRLSLNFNLVNIYQFCDLTATLSAKVLSHFALIAHAMIITSKWILIPYSNPLPRLPKEQNFIIRYSKNHLILVGYFYHLSDLVLSIQPLMMLWSHISDQW